MLHEDVLIVEDVLNWEDAARIVTDCVIAAVVQHATVVSLEQIGENLMTLEMPLGTSRGTRDTDNGSRRRPWIIGIALQTKPYMTHCQVKCTSNFSISHSRGSERKWQLLNGYCVIIRFAGALPQFQNIVEITIDGIFLWNLTLFNVTDASHMMPEVLLRIFWCAMQSV